MNKLRHAILASLRKNARRTTLVGLIALLVLAITAGTASATGTPTPTNSSVTVIGAVVDHSTATWQGELVAGWTIKHTAAEKRRIVRHCITSDGWNYYSRTDLSKGRHWDHHMRLCRDKKSPTGWVKVGGGDSGSHCWNPATPAGHHPLSRIPIIPGSITEVSSFARFFAGSSAYSNVGLHIQWFCGSNEIKVDTSAKGTASASALLKLAVKVKGKISAFHVGLQGLLKTSATSSAYTIVEITCSGTPSTPPPAQEKPTGTINAVNQVPAGKEAKVCANYNVPGNDSGTAKFGSDLGSYPTTLNDGSSASGSTIAVTGGDSGYVCTYVRAPNDADKPASFTLTFYVRDNTTGLSSAVSSTTAKITYDTPPN